jgi:lipopolysaccharide transport system permease protein
MLTKIYFPRVIIPTSTVIVNCGFFFFSFVTLIGLMFWFHFAAPDNRSIAFISHSILVDSPGIWFLCRCGKCKIPRFQIHYLYCTIRIVHFTCWI